MSSISQFQHKYDVSDKVFQKALKLFANGCVKMVTAEHAVVHSCESGKVYDTQRRYKLISKGLWQVYYTCTCPFGLTNDNPNKLCSHALALHIKYIFKSQKKENKVLQ